MDIHIMGMLYVGTRGLQAFAPSTSSVIDCKFMILNV